MSDIGPPNLQLHLHLPFDVILDILDIFSTTTTSSHQSTAPASPENTTHDIYEDKISKDALRSCALVCSEWTLPAQKRLVHSIHIQSPQATLSNTFVPRPKTTIQRFQSLLDTITSPASTNNNERVRGRVLGRSIHHFALIEPPTFGDPSKFPLARVSSSDFSRFLACCPHLRSLTIMSGIISPTVIAQEVLQGLTNLTSLSITEERPHHRPSIDAFLDALPPTLKRLSWASFRENYAYNNPSLETIGKHVFEHVSLDFRTCGPNSSTLFALLAYSHTSLTSLSLPYAPDARTLLELLRAHGRTLRSLSIGGWTSQDLALSTLTPDLQVLECTTYPFTHAIAEIPWQSLKTLIIRPGNPVHHSMYGCALDRISQVLIKGMGVVGGKLALESLEVDFMDANMALGDGKHEKLNMEVARLVGICAGVGVTLKTSFAQGTA